jgi:5'-3' exonuclease
VKVHLVDGTYELFRMFYGAPNAADSKGREVGATRALLRNLLMLVHSAGVTHVGVAYDHVIESFRNDLWPGYKTGDGIDPALKGQFPLVERAASAIGVVMWPMIEFEADDAIATAAARFADHPGVEQVVLCSPDKDLAQCVRGDRVVCWDRRRDQWLDEDGVRAKFGVSPSSIADYLALVGDAADGYPGIPKWGARSAAAVLSKFGTIEAIPDDAKAWGLKLRGADALAQSLKERRAEALLFKQLATLRFDCPLKEDLAAMEWRGCDKALLAELCADIEDDDFMKRVRRWRE